MIPPQLDRTKSDLACSRHCSNLVSLCPSGGGFPQGRPPRFVVFGAPGCDLFSMQLRINRPRIQRSSIICVCRLACRVAAQHSQQQVPPSMRQLRFFTSSSHGNYNERRSLDKVILMTTHVPASVETFSNLVTTRGTFRCIGSYRPFHPVDAGTPVGRVRERKSALAFRTANAGALLAP